MKDVKVLGPGCKRCQTTADMVQAEADKLGIVVKVEKVTDLAAIAGYGIAATPGIVIDGKVVHAGGLPKAEDIATWLQDEKKPCSCSGGMTLIFSCSGAADVGAIADQTARKLSREGAGKMFCLTGIGGRVASIVKTAKAADKILAIDGCAQNCARHTLEEAGFANFEHVQLGGLGMEKGMTPANDGNIEQAAEAARQLLTC